jgi:hypothetical protein
MAGIKDLARRGSLLSAVTTRDAAFFQAGRFVELPGGVRPDALDAGVAWLERTHDATGRRGSSKGYSLLHGWLPAYPETTGYVVGTLLAASERRGRPDLAARATEMADWEIEVQEPDGGIMEGQVGTVPRRSVVFNTGMVMHGWLDLVRRGERRYEEALGHAAQFLVRGLRADGTWNPAIEYSGIPHTYNSRVSWAMLRWALHAGDEDTREAAERQLDWTVRQQRDNGWFDNCVFKPGMGPSTHGIAYTLRGLLESHALLPDEERGWLAAVERTSEVLIRRMEVLGGLPANYDAEWRPTASHTCLTGCVQLGGVWLRLFQLNGDARYLSAGLKAVELGAARQERLPLPEINGALAGSFPAWGRYAPLQYPNWATKFMVDSLALREECLPA